MLDSVLGEQGIATAALLEGSGIDPAFADKVFERFTTSRKAGDGTGLGLAIVRAVAEAHGGTAEVRATGEGGTTIALTLRRS